MSQINGKSLRTHTHCKTVFAFYHYIEEMCSSTRIVVIITTLDNDSSPLPTLFTEAIITQFLFPLLFFLLLRNCLSEKKVLSCSLSEEKKGTCGLKIVSPPFPPIAVSSHLPAQATPLWGSKGKRRVGSRAKSRLFVLFFSRLFHTT